VPRPAAHIEDPVDRLQLDQVEPLHHPTLDFPEKEVGMLTRAALLVERRSYRLPL
jgi:hypothetical protein